MILQVSSAGGAVNSIVVADPSLVADRYLTLDLEIRNTLL